HVLEIAKDTSGHHHSNPQLVILIRCGAVAAQFEHFCRPVAPNLEQLTLAEHDSHMIEGIPELCVCCEAESIKRRPSDCVNRRTIFQKLGNRTTYDIGFGMF